MTERATETAPALDERIARLVAEALRRVRWGTVTLTLRDGVVVQIEQLERTRLVPPEK